MSALLSQLFGGKGSPIGTAEFHPAAGDTLSKADGSLWLQTGKAVSLASAPIAATLPHLMVSGLASTLPGANGVIDVAVDSTGQYYVAVPNNSATYVWVSNTYGASWTQVAHGMATPPTAVVYANSRFVLAGNTATTINTSMSSNNGASFTANATTVTSGATASTARIAYGNAQFTVIIGGTATGALATAPSAGTTFTAQNAPVATYAGTVAGGWTNLTYVPSASLWLISIGYYGANSFYTSPTCATGSFTASAMNNLPSIAVFGMVSIGSCALVLSTSVNGGLFRTTDGQSFKAVTPVVGIGPNGASPMLGSIRSNGTTVYAALSSLGNTDIAFFTSTDGQTFSRRWNAQAITANAYTAVMVGAGSSFVYLAGSPGTAGAYSTTWPSCDLVGTTTPIFASASANAFAPPVLYYRIT